MTLHDVEAASSPSDTKSFDCQLSADRERESLEQFVRESGDNVKIEAWDWRYYAEKVRALFFSIPFLQIQIGPVGLREMTFELSLMSGTSLVPHSSLIIAGAWQVRKSKYDLDDEEVKPYFSLDRSAISLFSFLVILCLVVPVSGTLLLLKQRISSPKYHYLSFLFQNVRGCLRLCEPAVRPALCAPPGHQQLPPRCEDVRSQRDCRGRGQASWDILTRYVAAATIDL